MIARTHRAALSFLAASLLLSACSGGGGAPPSVSLVSPVSGETVSGTVAAQVSASAADGVAKVQLFARAPGSALPGAPLGSAVQDPFVVAFNSARVPNGTPLELYATATGRGGGVASSDPVPVRAQNPGAPKLSYLAAFTLPHKPVGAQSARAGTGALPDHTSTVGARPPQGWRAQAQPGPAAPDLRAAAEDADHNLEWAWASVGGASGYRVYLSAGDLAGPYAEQYAQTPGTAALQKYSRAVTARDGDQFAGVVTALSGAALAEGAYSNADTARFLPLQQSASPADGQSVQDGRPSLTWSKLSGASGYLYFVYDASPWRDTANVVWSNYPQASSAQSAPYPSDRAALPKGTYFWWVAGVRFDDAGNSEAFSFSAPRTLVVP